MATILNFNGLYGDDSGAVLPDFIHCEPLETRSRQYNWQIKRHIHAYLFQVFCIEAGTGKLLIDRQEIIFTGPCFIVIPENTLHGFVFDANTPGTVMTLSVSYVEKLFSSERCLINSVSRASFPAARSLPCLRRAGS